MNRTVRHNEIAAFLLRPVLLSIYVFGFWCLAAQMGWASEFVIQDGPFGNWMVWMGVAGGMHFGMKRLADFDFQRAAGALSNVILNAADACDGTGQITIEAHRDRLNGRDAVRIDVSDTGSGIAPEDLEHIWEPYVTRKAGGTGLGLAIARQAVLAHDGTVEARSTLGKGTRIRFMIPAHSGAGNGSDRDGS